VSAFQRCEFDHDDNESLRKLGRYLCTLGQLPRGEFEGIVRMHLWMAITDSIENLKQLLRNNPRAPVSWSQTIQVSIQGSLGKLNPEGLGQSLLRTTHPLLGTEERLLLAQNLVLRFGKLLEAWPSLIESAHALKSRGIILARRL
jgi:hypothetical protein